MPRTLIIVAFVLSALAGIFWLVWMPLPSAQARDAAGEERVVRFEDRGLSYYVSGEGQPVLLLASLGREASDFNELVLSLNSAGYRTIAFEAHGIGGTDLPESQFDLLEIADDVAKVVETEIATSEKVVVIGHAFGNRVARAYATLNDPRVQAIVLVASGGRKPIPSEARASLAAIFDPRRTFAQRKADVDFAFFAEGNTIPDYWTRGWHTGTALWQADAALQSYQEWGAGGTKPMLILQADEDEIAPSTDAGIPLAREFPSRTKLVVIKGAGHAFLPERPLEVASEIISFIRDVDLANEASDQ
ncbi:MAG: alpha/beta hydrolase [Pseudomonadota bacterium]